MITPNFFNTIFVIPILNILVFLYKGFSFLKIPGAFGFAIIGLTIFIRLLLHPFFKQQIETAKKVQELKPYLDKLSKKYKNDQKKLQQEQLKLYQQAGINPGAGCFFMIIQIPIFIGLYNTLSLFLMNGGGNKIIENINKVLYVPFLRIDNINSWFFGFNLAVSPSKSGIWYYFLIPVITGILQFFQANVSQISGQEKKDNLKKENDKKENQEKDEFQSAMNTQMKFLFPLMIGWFSYNLPVGLSLYWNIFSLFTIFQYRQLSIKNSNNHYGKN